VPSSERFAVTSDLHPTFDTGVAHLARVYNYWLGGKDNYAADRAAGDAAIAAYPDLVASVRANRAFLARSVRYLVTRAGIRQFLDIGTGIPSANNTHEVAQAQAPDSRVVYVDNDPVVLAHARALLTGTSQGATDYIDADLRNTDSILEQAARTLDFSRPVSIMLIAVLHMISDDDGPYEIVARLIDAVPSGSCLALTHVASDIEPEKQAEAARRYNRLAHDKQNHRSHDEVLRLFSGLDIVAPGIVPVQQWHPDSDAEAKGPSAMWGAVGIKP
jgi:trans-aconitate methyltransferase